MGCWLVGGLSRNAVAALAGVSLLNPRAALRPIAGWVRIGWRCACWSDAPRRLAHDGSGQVFGNAVTQVAPAALSRTFGIASA